MLLNAQQSLVQKSGVSPHKSVGRFAPSPTGDLHFGSLLAAMASYCDAKKRGGDWLLRIDDIDAPRSIPGSADAIQISLEQFGFEWSGPVQWQSHNLERYHQALADLVRLELIYACNCSRRSLPQGKIYPGFCQNKRLTEQPDHAQYLVNDHALRCHMKGNVTYEDAVQGTQHTILSDTVGDIIIWRRDSLVGYTLACAIDDASTTTDVVRGADLLPSTTAQIAIMTLLGMQPPRYAHIPVAVDANGDKLSKHSKAQSISALQPVPTLRQAWRFLGQQPIEADSIADFWTQAIPVWQLSRVPNDARLAI